MAEKFKVDSESSAYQRMDPHWQLVDDLMGGTIRMREAGKEWLPQEENESEGAYNTRLERTILSNYYEDTLKKLTGKPFATEVQIENLPDAMKPIIEDMDGTGQGLTEFTRQVFKFGVHHGFSNILVDYPSLEPGLTKEQEKAAGARPYFVLYRANQLISYRQEEGVLTQVVFEETHTEYPDQQFGEKEVVKYRVITPTTWELWAYTDETKSTFIVEESGVNTFGSIPLVNYYTNFEGYLEATPALEDLGYTNLEDWQKKSDYSNLLHYTGMATLFAKGVDSEFAEANKAVGTNRMMTTTSETADAKYLEISGAGATALRNELQDIRERAMMHSLQPLVGRTGSITATGQAIEESNNQSDLQAWIRTLEIAMLQSFEIAAEWMNIELPEDFSLKIFNDFGMSIRGQKDIEQLLKARLSKDIDQETFLRELKRRGTIHESEVIEDIVARISAEPDDELEGIFNATIPDQPES